MPQMSPMMWIFIFFMVILFYMFMLMKNYFLNLNYKLFYFLNNFKKNKMKWQW